MENREELISLSEYAAIHGVSRSAIQNKALRGLLGSTRKIGRNWVIDKNEPYIDGRVKSGGYVGWRKHSRRTTELPEAPSTTEGC